MFWEFEMVEAGPSSPEKDCFEIRALQAAEKRLFLAALCQGMTSVVPNRLYRKVGFSPCGPCVIRAGHSHDQH